MTRTPYIIAEIGVNHDGHTGRALDLVRAASDADADAVKLQAFDSWRLDRQDLKHLEVSVDLCAKVIEYAHWYGLDAILTVCHDYLIDRYAPLDWDAFKVRSPDIRDQRLADGLRKCGRPLIVSTGGATMADVSRAVAWHPSPWRNRRLTLLHCVPKYPTPYADADLKRIAELQTCGVPVGFSDHTLEVGTGAEAVRHGAVMLERHITYDRSAVGPDHHMSTTGDEFASYVTLARNA